MRQTDIAFPAADVELAGSLALPAGEAPFPAVLMIAGSGPVDRNENHRRLPLNIFGQLAEHLAAHGIASLRYDKRGVGASTGDYWSTGFHDNAGDAVSALNTLRERSEVDATQLFLLGHSEGALIATKLAGDGADVAGAVLLSGAAQSGEDVLLWQGRQVAKGLSGLSGWIVRTFRIDPAKQQRKQLTRLKNSDADVMRVQLVAKVNARWMREFMAYDPADSFVKIRIPVLGITGSKDIQVDPADLERLAEIAETPFEWHVVPDVSHILRVDPAAPSIKDYRRQVKEPIDQRVVDLILDWLQRQVQRATA